MLNKIHMEHFKCFEKLTLPLGRLTLLSGLNAAGKSTILQALSLLHQTAVESEWNKTLLLDGKTISLGTSHDVIDNISGQGGFQIGLSSDTCDCFWTMKEETRDELAIPIECITWREAEEWNEIVTEVGTQSTRIYRLLPETIWKASPHAQHLSKILIRLAYIAAERIGPRETYATTTPDQQTNVGTHGEFTPWFLHSFAQQKPMDGLVLPSIPPTLQRQTEAWMQHFFPGVILSIDSVRGANLVTMGIRTSDALNFHRPQNVGYGLTHILPIIASCLGAQPDDVIMIENPEAHLHPAGQSEIGMFLARSAAAGAQIIVETHSDHVLNGIRLAVKKGVIAHDAVSIHFFGQRGTTRAQVMSSMIDPNGTIDYWPEGFFDQFDKDTSELIDW